MARARNIKPAMFKNELLGTADPYITILFVGLWTLADRDGYLEDRPLRIKAEVFPYREGLDINGYLTELERLGFIDRYEAEGMKVIHILKFSEHQNPHKTEKAGVLPKKPENTGSCNSTVKAPLNNGDITEPAVLIPDSLNTDSLLLIPEKPEDSVPATQPQPKSKVDHLMVIEVYNEILPELPAVDPSRWRAKSARAKSLSARWKEEPACADRGFWVSFFEEVSFNDHWMKRKPFSNGDYFEGCNLEWLLTPKRFNEVVEKALDREKRASA